jgi:hypothetical protein
MSCLGRQALKAGKALSSSPRSRGEGARRASEGAAAYGKILSMRSLLLSEM